MAESSWVPQLKTEYGSGSTGSVLDIIGQNQKIPEELKMESDKAEYNAAIRDAAKTGLQSGQAGGGLGGTLTSAGTMLGIGSLGAATGTPLAAAGPVGWGVMAGGLLLSAHEKKKQEEAAREQAKIQAEMARRANLIQLARDSASQDFRLA